LLITTLLRCCIAASADLKVEEAYYWCYARHLSPGYFDHPPMVAWLIALFQPLGTSSLAVRLPAVLLFAASGWLLFLTLRRCFDSRVAEGGLWLHSLLPAFHWYSVLMLPDSPLMFFWCLGIYATCRLVQDEDPRWWWVVGVATGLGMCSKYPALLIPCHTFLCCWVLRKDRRLWLCAPMLGAAALALLLFSPVIYWNATHEWASFRFQGGERFAEVNDNRHRAASLIYPAVMLGPFVYLASPFVLLWAWRRRHEPSVRFGLSWTVPFLALMLWVASRRMININWPIPGYLGFLLLLAPWMRGALRWSLVTPSAAFSLIPFVALVFPIAYANRGDDITQWRPMAEHARKMHADMPRPEKTFFLGYGYQAASELAFHGIPEDRLVSVNALGLRGLAYDYWTQPGDFVGWDAVMVTFDRVKSNGSWQSQTEPEWPLLRAAFARMDQPVDHIELRAGAPLRRYRYYRLYGYKGVSAK
jgi:4-amino-4-deoxy-L-arabinose transferase-like glycosyltransferase